jgi:hypothetical protein
VCSNQSTRFNVLACHRSGLHACACVNVLCMYMYVYVRMYVCIHTLAYACQVHAKLHSKCPRLLSNNFVLTLARIHKKAKAMRKRQFICDVLRICCKILLLKHLEILPENIFLMVYFL